MISDKEQASIVLFNYETFRLENESTFDGTQIANQRKAAWQYYEQQVKNNASQWRKALGTEYETLKSDCTTSGENFLSLNKDELAPYKQSFVNFFSPQHLAQHPQHAQSIQSLAKQLPFSIDELSREEFDDRYKPFAFKNNFLPVQLGRIIWDYHLKSNKNQMHRFLNETQGKSHEVLTDKDFVSTHGEKPWLLINDILQTFDTLKYKVDSPEDEDYFGNYKLRLLHVEKPELEVDFNALSSGEKILMALVASVYKSASDGTFPSILLLDEIDASLHPSMIMNMLNVIQNIFLKHGVTAMLVTHSPTTIALAPEDSVYVVNSTGPKRIEKKSRADALYILTQGFATLDEGVRLFDEVTKSPLTIITEGNNVSLIKMALRHHKIEDVKVMSGFESVSGKNQLKTLFDFFSRTNHNNKVVFVWDCDATEFSKLNSSKNTYPYTMPKNDANKVAKNGIENMFPEELFEGLYSTIKHPDEDERKEFTDRKKVAFLNLILTRNQPKDFVNFEALADELKRIKGVATENSVSAE